MFAGGHFQVAYHWENREFVFKGQPCEEICILAMCERSRICNGS